MDTNKAKNAVIIILVVLNAVLFYFIRVEESAFIVSRARYTAIHNLLLRNRMALYVNIEGSNFQPMPMMWMEVFPDDTMEYLLYGRGRTYHRRGIFEFTADFGRQGQGEMAEFNEQAAVEVGGAFLAEFEAASGVPWNFTLAGVSYADGEFFVQFMGHYDGIKVASNLVLFIVNRYGIFEIHSQLARPTGFFEIAHEIYSVDEALLTLMHELLREFPGRNIRINGYEVIYYYAPDLYVGISNAWPAYMFSVTVLEPHERITVFVDAYRNTVVTDLIQRDRFTHMNR